MIADYSIGVVGLGRMGSGIAARLAEADFDVVGYDLDETARANAADVGVDVRSTAAAVATGCDIVVTSLPTPGAVRAAYTASDGLLSSGASFVAVEMSTIDPDTTLAIAEQAADAGITFVDAPVSGGPKDATRGTLTVLIGGPASVIESEPVTRLLTTIADTRHHVGDVGAGHTAKLVNNVMSMGNLLVTMEAVSLGVRRGLDGELLLDALANAGGSSNQFRKRLPRVLNRNFEAGFHRHVRSKRPPTRARRGPRKYSLHADDGPRLSTLLPSSPRRVCGGGRRSGRKTVRSRWCDYRS